MLVYNLLGTTSIFTVINNSDICLINKTNFNENSET